jgi:hypothetical protein
MALPEKDRLQQTFDRYVNLNTSFAGAVTSPLHRRAVAALAEDGGG